MATIQALLRMSQASQTPTRPGTADSTRAARHIARRAFTEPWSVRWLLIVISLMFLGLFIGLPLAIVFAGAFEEGWQAYFAAIRDPAAWAAIRLTLFTAAVAVPLTMVFGVAAAWVIAKFEFRGKQVLTTLIDREGTMRVQYLGVRFDAHEFLADLHSLLREGAPR